MGKTIVIIDDSPTIRKSVMVILERNGYDILECENGDHGKKCLLSLLESGIIPSMIITDIIMPVMNGFEVLNFLKNHEILRFVPVFVMTTESDSESMEKGQELGALGWIVKPFNEDTLLEIVEEYAR